MSKNLKIIIALSVVLLGIIGGGIYYFNENYIYTNTIANNISIDNVDVSLLSKEEAILKLEENIVAKDIILKNEDKEYTLSGEDLEIEYNFKEVVEESFEYTKTESYFENVKRFMDLKEDNKNFELKLSYNEVKLTELIEQISEDINVKVKNAEIFISASGSKTVSSSNEGKELDVVDLKEKIYDSLSKKEFKEVDMKVNIEQPKISSQELNKINTVLGQFTTNFSAANQNRSYNIYLAAKSSGDILLMPGEEYSYNKAVGKVNAANGYKDAPVIVNGKLEPGIGGGICQVSTTIFNAVMNSGLDITVRHNHSLKSSYSAPGYDAMVSDWSDFRFVNDGDSPVYIKNVYSNGSITTKVFGASDEKQNIRVRVESKNAGNNIVYKTYRDFLNSSGSVIRTEHIDDSVYKDGKEVEAPSQETQKPEPEVPQTPEPEVPENLEPEAETPQPEVPETEAPAPEVPQPETEVPEEQTPETQTNN